VLIVEQDFELDDPVGGAGVLYPGIEKVEQNVGIDKLNAA
jgi:hypothetical protein